MASPTDITGLTHRLRASKLGLTDGSYVSAAAFEVGGMTLSQGTLTNQPKYVASSINGLAGIRFSGSSTWLEGNNPSTLTQPFSLTYVIKLNAFDQYVNQQLFYSTGLEFVFNTYQGNTYGVYAGGNQIYGGQPSVGIHSITINCNTDNTASVYIDGRFVFSGAAGTASLPMLRIGAYSDGSRGFNGDICEIIGYNKILNATDRATLDSYVQSTYGFTMADVTGAADAVNGLSGLTHRFRASKITNFVNNMPVPTTTFEVGGITLNQNSSGNQPYFMTNSINNQAGLSFNGSSFWMDASVPSALSQSFTMTAIVRIGDAASLQEIINTSGTSMVLNDLSAATYGFWAGSEIYGDKPTTGAHAITIVANSGATSYLYIDGSLAASGSIGNGAINAYSFGRNPSSGRYFNGDIAELIVYNRALSASELQTVDTYIQSTYMIKMNDVPASVIATESFTGANGAPWPAQWTGSSVRNGGVLGSASIQNNMGAMVGGSSDSTYREYLSGIPNVDNVDLVISFMVQKQDDHLIAIGIDADNTISTNSYYNMDPINSYWLLIHVTTNSANTSLDLYKNTSQSSRNEPSSAATVTTIAGTSYTVRVQRFGIRVRAKYWQTSNPEPSAWNIAFDDTATNTGTMQSGKVFISLINNYTGAQPVYFDNMTVSSPGATAANTSLGRYVRSKDIPSLIITAAGVQGSSLQFGNYTLQISDAGKAVEINSTTVSTVTIPTNASVNFPVGTIIDVCRIGTGQVNVVGASGVTLDISQGTAIYARYSTIRLRQRATDEWTIAGASTPFYDPTTISGLVYRMRASTIGITAEGTPVASAPLEVGNLTLTQANSTYQPIWHARGKNGKPYITFDGVDDFIAVASGAPTYSQQVTVCVAAQVNNALSSQEMFKAGGLEMLLNQSALTWSTYAGSLINSPVVYGGVQYFTGVFGALGSQGSIQMYTNGVLTATGGGGGNSTSGGDLYVGTHPSTSRPLSADVYEFLVYNGTLAAADIAKLHYYMQAMYS